MPIIETQGATVITGEAIRFTQALAQRGALKLEILGMKRRGRPISTVIREQYGFKSKDKTKLLAELDAWIVANESMAQR